MLQFNEGIQRFRHEVVAPQPENFREFSNGKQPPALLIACSDVGVLSNLIRQTSPRELVILSTAGNIIPAYGAVQGGEAATVEYAIGVKKVQDVIVCGHTQCCAMKALMESEPLGNFPAVRSYLEHAEATRQIMNNPDRRIESPEERLQHGVEQNVLIQMHNLRTHPVIASALRTHQIRLHGWVYNVETGQISTYHEQADEFVVLQGVHEPDQLQVG